MYLCVVFRSYILDRCAIHSNRNRLVCEANLFRFAALCLSLSISPFFYSFRIWTNTQCGKWWRKTFKYIMFSTRKRREGRTWGMEVESGGLFSPIQRETSGGWGGLQHMIDWINIEIMISNPNPSSCVAYTNHKQASGATQRQWRKERNRNPNKYNKFSKNMYIVCCELLTLICCRRCCRCCCCCFVCGVYAV